MWCRRVNNTWSARRSPCAHPLFVQSTHRVAGIREQSGAGTAVRWPGRPALAGTAHRCRPGRKLPVTSAPSTSSDRAHHAMAAEGRSTSALSLPGERRAVRPADFRSTNSSPTRCGSGHPWPGKRSWSRSVRGVRLQRLGWSITSRLRSVPQAGHRWMGEGQGCCRQGRERRGGNVRGLDPHGGVRRGAVTSTVSPTTRPGSSRTRSAPGQVAPLRTRSMRIEPSAWCAPVPIPSSHRRPLRPRVPLSRSLDAGDSSPGPTSMRTRTMNTSATASTMTRTVARSTHRRSPPGS